MFKRNGLRVYVHICVRRKHVFQVCFCIDSCVGSIELHSHESLKRLLKSASTGQTICSTRDTVGKKLTDTDRLKPATAPNLTINRASKPAHATKNSSFFPRFPVAMVTTVASVTTLLSESRPFQRR